MRCAESVRVQAHFDGELDAISSLNIEKHLEQCAECSELLQSLEHTRAMLRQELPRFGASPALRARIQRALDSEEESGGAQQTASSHRLWRSRPFWWGSLSGVAATAAAGAIAFLVLALPLANPLADAVLDAHVNSLMSAHLIDVVSTDKHTVKPWFAGHAEVSPAVADFAPQGYKLTGGRVDNLDHQRAAVIVYQHGAHIVNVFCLAAPRGPLPGNMTRHGYHIAFWRSGDLAYAAISDTSWEELLGLERLLRSLEPSDAPPKKPPSDRE